MAKLAIPERFSQTLAAFMSMDAGGFMLVLDGLKKVKPGHSPDVLERQFVENVKVPDLDSRQVFEILMSLYFLEEGRPEVTNVIQDVLEAASTSKAFKSASEKELKLLEDRLSQLLSVPAVKVMAHALSVSGDYDCTFVRSRILTDVRAVFMEDGSEQPAGAVIMHTLKLTYLQNGEQKNFYVALDESDLTQLEQSIKRASLKQSSLNTVLDKSALASLRGE